MSTSINDRINRLRSRRSGLDRSSVIAMDAKDFIVNRSLTKEAWEHRVKDKPNTTFALGAMQEVDPTYTRISIETAERVSVCVRPSHLPNPVKPGHGVHLNLGGHQF